MFDLQGKNEQTRIFKPKEAKTDGYRQQVSRS